MRTPAENAAREVCFRRIARRPPFKPWLFEHTPAAADSAPETYLSAIDVSDLFIWLVGPTTSDAVQRELQRGLDNGIPFLVFELPPNQRDDETQEWLRRVRDSAKTRNVADVDDLARELDAALDDFVTSAVRSRPRLTHTSDIVALEKRTRAIAIARWLAVGVSTEVAQELAADLSIGTLSAQQLPNQDEPLRVIEAPVGAGKTIAAVRYLQRAIVRATAIPSAPLPVWLRPDDLPDLEDRIGAANERVGRPRASSVVVVIDGLDEVSRATAGLVLDRARVVAFSSEENRVLLTSRPSGLEVRPTELASMPELTSDDCVALVNRAFGLELSPFTLQQLPQTVRSAVARPLFCLLFGRRIAEGGRSARVNAPGDLIASLITDAFGRAGRDKLASNRELANLARISLDRGEPVVPLSDAEDLDVGSLIASRLIVETDDGVSFSLPILREWFGAVALRFGLVDPAGIAKSPEQRERWRYALLLGVASLPKAAVDRTMDALSRLAPGFASEAIASTSLEDRRGGRADDIGRRLRDAMKAMCAGLGPLADATCPQVGNDLATLGIHTSADTFAYGWSRVTSSPQVVDLPPDVFAPGRDSTWNRRMVMGSISKHPLWPWNRVRDDLRVQLGNVLGQRVLFPDIPEMRVEAAWAAAVNLQPIGEHAYRDLDADHIRERLHSLGDTDVLRTNRTLVPLDPLRELLATGLSSIACPYPAPDLERNSWIWSGFSSNQLLNRTRTVYVSAFRIYQAFVEYFFPTFSSSLLLHQLLPAKIEGLLHAGSGGGIESAPSLEYIIVPVPPGQQTVVDIQLADSANRGLRDWGWSRLPSVADAIARNRPNSPPWMNASARTTVLHVFGATPATTLAEGWLAEDLHRIGWLERRVIR